MTKIIPQGKKKRQGPPWGHHTSFGKWLFTLCREAKSSHHEPDQFLQDSDEAQLRECLGLPARAWAVLGDIGPGRPATQAVPNAKYYL